MMAAAFALLVLVVVALLSPSHTHPQCLDFQPPFSDQRTWRTLYCDMYRDFGCCHKDGRQKTRVPLLLNEIAEDGRDSDACEPYLRNVTCLNCSPYAAHIFDSESSDTTMRAFPLLCRDYCEEAYAKCYRTFLRYFKFRARDFGVKNNPRSEEDLLKDAKTFCAAVTPAEDGPYCYPKVLDGPQFPEDSEEQAPNDAEGELGCICGRPVASGLRNPLAAVHAGDGSGRLFIAEQIGVIRILLLRSSTLLERPFLDITSRVRTSSRVGDERGLLGIAFHPNYKDNGRVFVCYSTRSTSAVRVSEFLVREDDPNRADPDSEREILTVSQPLSNHNGGMLLFKEGYLLFFLGDGGGAGDRFGRRGNGQDRSTLLGSVLRIDVDNRDQGKQYAIPPDNPFVNDSSSKPEIYAYGVRNPWRCSIDRGEAKTGKGAGRVFCGDVGQNRFEEVDIIEKGGNYGWRAFEGTECYNSQQCLLTDVVSEHVAPIHTYPHSVGVSVTGGYVYRGCLYPNLQGLYIFGDYGSGRLFFLRENKTSGEWEHGNLCMGDNSVCTGGLVGTEREKFILSFGEDEEGEIYILTTSRASPTAAVGVVYQIVDPARGELPFKCRNF